MTNGVSIFRGFSDVMYRLVYLLLLLAVISAIPVFYLRAWHNKNLIFGTVLMLATVGAIGVFLTSSCCENDRYFVHLAPMFFPMYAFVWTLLRGFTELGEVKDEIKAVLEKRLALETD